MAINKNTNISVSKPGMISDFGMLSGMTSGNYVQIFSVYLIQMIGLLWLALSRGRSVYMQ